MDTFRGVILAVESLRLTGLYPRRIEDDSTARTASHASPAARYALDSGANPTKARRGPRGPNAARALCKESLT